MKKDEAEDPWDLAWREEPQPDDCNNTVVFMSIFPRFVTKNHTLC